MTMSFHPFYGVALAGLSKLVEDGPDLGRDHPVLDDARGMVDQLEEWVKVTKDFNLDDPISWVRTSVKAASHALDASRSDDPWSWAENHDYTLAEGCPEFALRLLYADPNNTIVAGTEYCTALWVPMTDDYSVALMYFPEFDSKYELYIPRRTEDRLRDLMGEYVWSFWENGTVSLDHVNGSAVASEIDLTANSYYGPLSEVIDIWGEYLRRGIRRNVLLNGGPGTGKSTLAVQAARQLSERTLFIRHDFVGNTSASDWENLLDLLKPEVVIMDEVDKIGSGVLSSRLKMFEEGYCGVPLVIMTSNDLDEIPDPMLRPGRIDQTIEVKPPSGEEREKVIRDLAEREGVSVSEDMVSGDMRSVFPGDALNLCEMMGNLSASHVVEWLRRYKVEGGDRSGIDGDVTFELADDEEQDENA